MTYLLSFPFEHYLPRIFHLHTRSIVVICLPDWPNTWPLQGLILKFSHRNFSFFFPMFHWLLRRTIYLLYKNWEIVKSRESKKSHSINRFIGQNKKLNSSRSVVEAIFGQFVFIYVGTYWFDSFVILSCKIYICPSKISTKRLRPMA